MLHYKAAQAFIQDMSVNPGRAEVGVALKRLDHPQISHK